MMFGCSCSRKRSHEGGGLRRSLFVQEVDGLRAHFGRYVGQTRWCGPYFGVLHSGEVPTRFCYFGRSYPDIIRTRVPDPNVK